MFLPVSKNDMEVRGWKELDIILITGDAYVDHPSYGAAVIGRTLENSGYRVGIIAQPDWKSLKDFQRLGRPRLFFGITSGNTDSMVANYSANKRKRKVDKYSPGNRPGLRPDRALIVYSNRVREAFKDAAIVIGGIEASLRRFAHYDYWDNKVRRSMLLDTRADILVYGMGEDPILKIAEQIKTGRAPGDIRGIKGTCVIINAPKDISGCVEIPSFEEVSEDKDKFNEAFTSMYSQMNPYKSRPVAQKHGTRFVVQFPPPRPLKKNELDKIYELPYEYESHPEYSKEEGVKGLETVRFSITSHRGCPGECSFCALYFHQGRIVASRSSKAILAEAKKMSVRKDFKGTITDIGGPTANLYDSNCVKWGKTGYCKDKKCLVPEKCSSLDLGYSKSLELYEKILAIPKVKHVFIGSGFRYDLFLDKAGEKYLKAICEKHISGYIKVAPEHSSEKVLKVMNKTSFKKYEKFVEIFNRIKKEINKKVFIVNYFISSHPGSGLAEAKELASYLRKRKIVPEQIQDFLPTPMTLSTAIYYTGKDPFTGKKVYIPKTFKERKAQWALLQPGNSFNKKR